MFDTEMVVIAIPGLSEPVSALTHLLGSAVLAFAAVAQNGEESPIRWAERWSFCASRSRSRHSA